jgi:kumamolisin
MRYNPSIRVRREPPRLTIFGLLAACSSESTGAGTESASAATQGIEVSAATSLTTTTVNQPEVTATLDPSFPDSSVSHSTMGAGSTGQVSSATSGVPATTGDTGGCDSGGTLCEVPPEEQVPTETPDGLPGPLPGVYDDQGAAPPEDGVRALIGFANRDRAALEQKVVDMYDPKHPGFRKYMGVEQWKSAHAPLQADYDLIKEWLTANNLTVTFDAHNRLLIAFTGSVKDFNATFKTTLHICLRKNPWPGWPAFPVYCTLETFTLPKFVADRTTGLVAADLPAAVGVLPNEAEAVTDGPPGSGGYTPGQIAVAYEFTKLYDMGFTGQGVKLGVVAAATYHSKDLQTFWKLFGVVRELPQAIDVMEPVVTRNTETILDTQWATVMAPGAEVIVYQAPNNRNTGLLFAWNEAIGRGEVSVLTNSFAHREDSEPPRLRHQYDESALMGAALGITMMAASGDSARPDTPGSSPYVTCVGGTRMAADGQGKVQSEIAWSLSGSGDAKTFDVPDWQTGVVHGTKRAMSDVALHASALYPYWILRYGQWEAHGGTSFSSPVFAAMIAVINSYRRSKGLPDVGFINLVFYIDFVV